MKATKTVMAAILNKLVVSFKTRLASFTELYVIDYIQI